jgi:hypothetical protein
LSSPVDVVDVGVPLRLLEATGGCREPQSELGTSL